MKLAEKKCRPCDGTQKAMSKADILGALKDLPGWNFDKGRIEKNFSFKNYYETTAFVNAVVWIAHREDHHPEIKFGYKECRVFYSTHAVKGLSRNDFICASKIEKLLS